MSTLAGCSDSYLRHMERDGDDDQNTRPSTGPADAPPNLPGSSLFENTCFGLLTEDSIAPLDTETGNYYQPVVDWMVRTRIKLGIDLLQRLSHYDPERIEAVMQEYEEAGTDPTIDEAMEHMRELLVERGVTVWWQGSEDASDLRIMLGDQRSDFDFAMESRFESLDSNRIDPWMIPDMRCSFYGNNRVREAIGVNKMAFEDWDDIPWGVDISQVSDDVSVSRVLTDSQINDFDFIAADANYCLPLGDDTSDYDEDDYWFPDGTICFDDDIDPFEQGDLDNETLLPQTTDNRILQLSEGTELLINAISGGQQYGRVFFDGDWFEE